MLQIYGIKGGMFSIMLTRHRFGLGNFHLDLSRKPMGVSGRDFTERVSLVRLPSMNVISTVP